MRRTKIIGTLGPANRDEQVLLEMILAGMDVARFNFSHDNYEIHLERLNTLSQLRRRVGKPVATMLDTRGPEIRIGALPGNRMELMADQAVTLTPRPEPAAQTLPISHQTLAADVHPGTRILLDDGRIELLVQEIDGYDLRCRVVNGGVIRGGKSVNVPDTALSLPYLSEQDKEDILFGIRHNMDFIAASFVQTAEDVEAIRTLLRENGGEKIHIIAKIECRQGAENAESILAAADGIMIARGDMGVELPLEEVPVWQKRLISLAHKAGKPSIVATQLLESMIEQPRPTRAEANDVANAVLDSASALMLSAETAAGQHPVTALRTLAKIVTETEKSINYKERLRTTATADTDTTGALAYAACTAAAVADTAALLSLSRSGDSARRLSALRPACPVLACSPLGKTCRQLSLAWGVQPFLIDEPDPSDTVIHQAVRAALAAERLRPEDHVLVTAGIPSGKRGINLIKAGRVTDL